MLDYLLEGLQRDSHPAHKHVLAAIYHLYTAVYLGARYTFRPVWSLGVWRAQEEV